MHIVSRRIVFYSLVALFVVGGFVAIASAFGFTIGTGGTVLRTGSFFISSIPRDAELFLDGTPVDERPGLLSGGTLVTNLTPRSYEVRATHEGRIAWHAELPIAPSIVTRATDIFLWPTVASSTVVATHVDSFSLSAGIPVVRSSTGRLSIEGVAIPGTEVVYASNNNATLITRTQGTVYLVGRGPAGFTVNLTSLFHSLKERDLGLIGTVPLIEVRPHPFSAGKILITTETSLYSLDTRRVSLERLATIGRIAKVAWNDSEVLLLGTDGALTAVDLVFKTSGTVPFTSSTLTRFESTPDGEVLLLLTENGKLLAHYRTSDAPLTVAENVTEFALGPAGNRLAYVSGNTLSVYFLAPYAGDVPVPQGDVRTVWEGTVVPHALAWNSSLTRYLFFLAGDEFIAAELGLHGERNHTTLAKDARAFAVTGFSSYLVRRGGELVTLSFEE